MAPVATPMAYTRGGQTCSKYELHIIKSKLQRAAIKKLKTPIYLLSALLRHRTVLGKTDLQK